MILLADKTVLAFSDARSPGENQSLYCSLYKCSDESMFYPELHNNAQSLIFIVVERRTLQCLQISPAFLIDCYQMQQSSGGQLSHFQVI